MKKLTKEESAILRSKYNYIKPSRKDTALMGYRTHLAHCKSIREDIGIYRAYARMFAPESMTDIKRVLCTMRLLGFNVYRRSKSIFDTDGFVHGIEEMPDGSVKLTFKVAGEYIGEPDYEEERHKDEEL